LGLLLAAPFAPAQQAGVDNVPNIVVEVVPHGNRRIPRETILARMFTKPGDVYDQATIERDFNSLWNTGYFEDIRFEREATPKGWIIHVYVKEKPTIRTITYVGLNSVSQSDVLDRFKERKVSLTVESQYDPTRVKRAEVVIKELLAEHGRQFATIRTEIRDLGVSAVSVTFVVKEGPKVKVGRIKFENNKHIKSRTLRYAMRHSRPIGIPHSIFLENLFARTFDATKLSEDMEMVRDAYQQKGYFKATVDNPQTKIRDTGHTGFHIPLLQSGPGKVVDITVPVTEGDRYRLKEITFTGNKTLNNSASLRRLFPIKDGDWFNIEDARKGIKALKDAYGQYGFINFTPIPDFSFDEDKHLITMKVDIDEGKQYYVRRIEFKGNTTTRDKVIRRELALDEGSLYNSKAWEISILRLNQLQYFEALKPDEDTTITQDNQNATVDLTLKVKEKGKNSIGLSGGVSGLAGSFIGLTYETNNFLGLGETLSLQASVGSQQKNYMFGFTEPYMWDRPLNFGFTVFKQSFNYNQAKQYQIATGQQLNLPQSVLQSLQNFSQSRTGFTVAASYPLKNFKRVGLTYSFDISSISVFSTISSLYFQELNFRNISGPDSLAGVVTSKIIPSYTMSTINNPQHPTSGRSIFLGGDIAGLGGNVSFVRPVFDFKQWFPMKGLHFNKEGHQALGIHFSGSFITGYAGHVAPPFERFFMGGDTDIRGFDIRSLGPVGFFVQRVDFPLSNPDGSAVPRDPTNPRQGNVTVPLPVYSIIFPGGDTQAYTNVEYRIPIVGPVTLAPFMDLGVDGVVRGGQLQVNATQLNTLNTSFFGCPVIGSDGSCGGGTQMNFNRNVKIVGASNWQPRMSTGLELQVIMPVVNAPFRIYYAYNPLRMDTFTNTPNLMTRSMFPAGGAGDYSYKQALATYGLGWNLKEPKKTFRFTVATTF
jgi:outer membrane protein insertion porin family